MTTTPTSGAADRAIENCPELNMGNYDEVDVERLNDWAIRANDEIDRLHALAAGQATAAQAVAEPAKSAAYAALPEPLEIDWPELHSQALGCGVEDRGLHNRYECAEYGWQDGVDKCAERVPEQIFDADQMHAFADATHALRVEPLAAAYCEELDKLSQRNYELRLASHGQAPAETGNSVSAQADSVLYDPKAVLDVFNSASAGSDKSSGYLRGILAVIAHWERRPELHRWMVPVQAQAAESVPAGDEHATFEANWRARNPHMPLNSRLRDDGRYGDHLIQKEWEAWQARAARASADSVQEDAAREAIEKVLALFPFNAPIQKFTVNNGPCLTADNDDEFYSVKRVLAFLTEIKTTLDAARKQGEKHDR